MEYTLYVDNGFMSRKGIYIKNPDKYTDAYHVDYRGQADMVVRRGGPQGPIVGRIDFHRWSNYVEIHFENNQRVEMVREGHKSKTQNVILPAAPKSKNFSWKPTSTAGSRIYGDLKLQDADGTVLALFDRRGGMKKDGTVTITVPDLEQHFLDQIFVSFVAIMEKQRRQRRGAAASSAASAASAASASSAASAGGGGGSSC